MIARTTKTEAQIRQERAEKEMSGVRTWTAFYRANPQRFVEDYLGLKLYPYQQIILYAMFHYLNFIYLAHRGEGKSFMLAVFCAAYCILYPGSKIRIASKTLKQAGEILDKFKESPLANSENLKSEISETKDQPTEHYIYFLNGSSIEVVTASETSRHGRATILIIDEYRMVDKKTIDGVLRKFLTDRRRPAYLDKPEYKDYPLESAKEIYASSCWYESHWSYELVKSYVVNMMRGRSYFCCAIPYQLSIKEGKLDKARIENEMSESTFNSVIFQMEMEALFWGQGNGGLYNFDEINRNRKIIYPFYPSFSIRKAQDKRLFIPPKQNGEIRLLSADIALMSSSKNKNDATSIFVNQMLPLASGKYVNNIVYADNNEGLRTDAQALIIRKLFEDLECDYIVLDTRGLGIGVSDALMGDITDPETGITYPALSCYNNEELAKRCLVENAPKVIWSVQGNAEFNSQCALALREAFKQGQVKLLISEYDAEDKLNELSGYEKLTPSDAMSYKLPYIHTSLLINELINLEYETKNNAVRVKEKSNMRKDRYSSLSYNIFVAKLIERERALETVKDPAWGGLGFLFRAPKYKKDDGRRH